MAIVRYHVLYHSEIAGKFDPHFGHRTALVSAADALDTSGQSRPVASNIATALSNNNLHNAKGGAVTVLDNVANLDPPAALTVS
jgi:hypothetical protein